MIQANEKSANSIEEQDPFKENRSIVIEKGIEREIKVLVVVENFRLIFYLSFFFIIIVGVFLTEVLSDEVDPGKPLRDAFGVVSICVFFDYPPSTYVLPSLWSITLMFAYFYAVAWIFRVWVTKEEGKVSRCSFVGYCIGFSYVVFSFIFFTTIFAVQPDPSEPDTMRIHTAPFTNFIVGLWVMAMMVTWYGDQVAWKNMDLPRWFFIMNYVMLAIQSFVVPTKVISHINCLSDLNGGLWWDPNGDKTPTLFFDFVDQMFLFTVLLYPTFQSAYLSYLRTQTHCVFMTLSDSRKSALSQMEMTQDFNDQKQNSLVEE